MRINFRMPFILEHVEANTYNFHPFVLKIQGHNDFPAIENCFNSSKTLKVNDRLN